MIRPSTSYHTFRRFYAQAQTPPASAPNANPVGYSRVVKQRDFLDAGREELVFSNIAGQDYDATLAYMPANYNGRLLKRASMMPVISWYGKTPMNMRLQTSGKN